ncbi:MAG: hypothetical protein J6C11_09390 [Spirochaetaceae bacterium]|nr:hypothetical protein [Spirochaetaceae bacterium]
MGFALEQILFSNTLLFYTKGSLPEYPSKKPISLQTERGRQKLLHLQVSVAAIRIFYTSTSVAASLLEPVLGIVAVGDGLHLDSKNPMTTFPISLTKYTYKHILSTDRTRLMLLVLSLQ